MSLWNSNLERHCRLGPPLLPPWPRLLPLLLPQPLPATASFFLDFTLGSPSTSSVSRGKPYGRIKYQMLFLLIVFPAVQFLCSSGSFSQLYDVYSCGHPDHWISGFQWLISLNGDGIWMKITEPNCTEVFEIPL